MKRDTKLDLATIVVAALIGAGITAIVVMTDRPEPPLVSCTGSTTCAPATRGPSQQLDPLAPTAPPSRH